MAKNVNFLDFTQQHALTEDECELVTFYRSLSPTKRQIILQMLYSMIFNDKKIKPKKEK